MNTFFLIVTFFVFCWPPVATAIEHPIGSDGWVDTKKTSPLELIQFLKTVEVKVSVPFKEKSKDWIKENEVIKLIALLDCDDPCGSVCLSFSSLMPGKRSTVSHEAACMIIGYFEGAYPLSLDSVERDVGGKKRALELITGALKKERQSLQRKGSPPKGKAGN